MQAISELWDSRDPKQWADARDNYWKMSSVKKNLELEKWMDRLDSEQIKILGPREWYDFLLNKYFRWKYTALNRFASTTKLLKRYEQTDNLGKLFAIKESLFAFDLADVREVLRIAHSIDGLGWAGASGLEC